MKVLSGVYPHGTYDGEIFFEGQEVAFRNIRDSEHAGHRHHPPGAGADPRAVDRREHLPRQRAGHARASSTGTQRTREAPDAARPASASTENPDTQIKKHRHRQAAAGRDRQGAARKDVKLLILDEPTAALNDDDSAAPARPAARAPKAKGITCIMISHKLNEIEAIADSITIIRDGRTIETLDVARRRGQRGPDHPRAWSAATSSTASRRTRRRSARCCFEVQDWTVAHPDRPRPRWSSTDANLMVRRGEIVGLAGLMGAGRTELARSVFGQSYGARSQRHAAPATARSSTLRLGAPRPSTPGLAYVTEDRKALGLNLLDDIKTSITSAGLQQDPARGVRRRQRGGRGRRATSATRMNIKAPTVEAGRRQALRRQPAEGRAGQVDVHRPGGADPRRADPRHRRRGQVRDLRDHQPAGRRRARPCS